MTKSCGTCQKSEETLGFRCAATGLCVCLADGAHCTIYEPREEPKPRFVECELVERVSTAVSPKTATIL